MGAWGTGIYDNDTAADLRRSWRQSLEAGRSVQEATEEAVRTYVGDGPLLGGDEEHEPFWMALAHLQWTHGGLTARTLAKVDALLRDDRALELWEPWLRAGRRRVLERLRRQLATPKAKPVVVKPYRRDIRWPLGAVYAIKQGDSRWLVLRTVGHLDGVGVGRAPRVQVLAWSRSELPTREEVARLRPATVRATIPGFESLGEAFQTTPIFAPQLSERGEYPTRRLKRLKGRVEAPFEDHEDTLVVPWARVDQLWGQIFWNDLTTEGMILAYRRDDGREHLLHVWWYVLQSLWTDSEGAPQSTYALCAEWFSSTHPSDPGSLASLPLGTGISRSTPTQAARLIESVREHVEKRGTEQNEEDLPRMVQEIEESAAPDGRVPALLSLLGVPPADRLRPVGWAPLPRRHALFGYDKSWVGLDDELRAWGY